MDGGGYHPPHHKNNAETHSLSVQTKEKGLDTFVIFDDRYHQGGITCGAIDEPRKSSKVIDERVIINFCDKNVVIACFCDKNVYR